MELPISSVDQTPDIMGKISAQVFLEGLLNENFSGDKRQKKGCFKYLNSYSKIFEKKIGYKETPLFQGIKSF